MLKADKRQSTLHSLILKTNTKYGIPFIANITV